MKYLALLVETVSCSIHWDIPFHSRHKFGDKKFVIIIRFKVKEVHELVLRLCLFRVFSIIIVTLRILFLRKCFYNYLASFLAKLAWNKLKSEDLEIENILFNSICFRVLGYP